jgi:radical SAM superfamily enzyme YgiQ (UPF0313 family)
LKIKLIGINARYSHSCLALFYLRNELETRLSGLETEICQFTINDPYYTLLQRLADDSAEFLFFSALIWNSDLVERLIGDLLAVDEQLRIVVGGPQAEIVGLNCAGSSRLTIFQGDIEAAAPEFFDDLQKGRLQKSYQASFLQSTNRTLSYPYRDEDFKLHLKNRAVYYESSRGCPFFCSYCLSSAEKGVFHKNLDQVFGELDDILLHNPETVRFVDRTFNDNPDRALAIWQYLKDRDPTTLFHFEIAPDRFTEPMFDFLDKLRPGLFQFEIGIQSTNPKTLEAIRRPIDSQLAAETINRLRRKENIHLHADLILGLPFETEETFAASINGIWAMQPHYIQMGLLKLLPGTEIRRQAQSWGYKAAMKPPYPVLANRWLDQQTLRRLYWLGECVEQCVNNRYFPTLWHYLLSLGEDMAAFFTSLARRFYCQGYFWKAATQKTLVRLLLEECEGRPDHALIRELICFDWLRCGHRFLPEQLCYREDAVDSLRRDLYHRLPQELDGLYSVGERKNFIKTSVFQRFSNRALQQAGLEPQTDPALVCFLNERESSVYRLNKICLMQITD